MTLARREFLAINAAGFLLQVPAAGEPSPMIELDGTFAAELPSRITVPRHYVETAISCGARILERRIYSSPISERLFARHNMSPLQTAVCTYLIPFASLEARQKAWDRWNADPDWQDPRFKISLREIIVCRVPADSASAVL